MDWPLRRTLLLAVGAWGTAVLRDLRARWREIFPLLSPQTQQRLARWIILADLQPAGESEQPNTATFILRQWPPLPTEDDTTCPLPPGVLYPRESGQDRLAFGQALFLERRTAVEEYVWATLDTLVTQARQADPTTPESGMPMFIAVIGTLAEEQASLCLWPMTVLIREYLAWRQLPDTTLIVLASSAEPSTPDPVHRSQAAGQIATALREWHAFWTGEEASAGALPLWRTDPVWAARLRQRPGDYLYIISRETALGTLISDCSLTTAAANLLDILVRARAQERIEEGLGLMRRDHWTLAPVSTFGAVSTYVPLGALLRRTTTQIVADLVTREATASLEPAEIRTLTDEADLFFRAHLAPRTLFDALTPGLIERIRWPEDDLSPPSDLTLSRDLRPPEITTGPLSEIIVNTYRWRDITRARLHPAALDEIPAGTYRDWVLQQIARDPMRYDQEWQTTIRAEIHRWIQRVRDLLDQRLSLLITQGNDLQGLRRAECFLIRLIDRVETVGRQARPAPSPRVWVQAAEPLAHKIQYHLNRMPLPTALAGRVLILLGVLIGLLWTWADDFRSWPGSPAQWGLASGVSLGALLTLLAITIVRAYLTLFLRRRCQQFLALVEADIREWLVFTRWPWVLWPYRPAETGLLLNLLYERLIRIVTALDELGTFSPSVAASAADPFRSPLIPAGLETWLARQREHTATTLARQPLLAPVAPSVAHRLAYAAPRGDPMGLATLLRQQIQAQVEQSLITDIRSAIVRFGLGIAQDLQRLLHDLQDRCVLLNRFWPEALDDRDLLVEQTFYGLSTHSLLNWSNLPSGATLIETGNPLEASYVCLLHGLAPLSLVGARLIDAQNTSIWHVSL